VAEAEATVAVAEPDRPLVFAGESFAVADKVGLMPLMQFAVLAKEGIDLYDADSLVAVYGVLRECIHAEDWERFEAHATKVHADDEDLMRVVANAIMVATTRPTSQPSDSSAGPPTTSGPSADGSGSPVTSLIERLETEGRPSIAYMVEQAQALRASG
jgi:hypothetical protein